MDWLSKETGRKFQHLFGKVSDVLVSNNGSKKGWMLKIRAEINLERPLLRGTNIKCDDQVVWVDFRYENLAMFGFYC